jgi:hypothetical protein
VLTCRLSGAIAAVALTLAPAPAEAWGREGHEVIAAIARSYLTPKAKARLDALLASDPDPLTKPDLLSRSDWADAYRNSHRETADWHFVDLELTSPDLKSACFNFPPAGPLASQGPAEDCVIDKVQEFEAELSAPGTAPDERLLALKFLLHFVGDLHQPMHAADNQDRGGNCVLLSLGGPRTTNLHSYWDVNVVEGLGRSSEVVASQLRAKITPAQRRAWAQGDAKAWAMETYLVGKMVAYTIGSAAGCDRDRGPIALPEGYAVRAQAAAAIQLERAGVRLAVLLNAALS